MNKQVDLGKEPILKLIFTLSIPMVVAQVINMLYNMVDRIYIGNMEEIGSAALTGVGVTFPIIIIITAFGALIASGGAPLAAIKLGENDKEKASEYLNNAFSTLTVLAVVLGVLFMVYKEPILYMFGASEDTIIYALEYLSIYLFGTISVLFSVGLNTFISAQGKAMVAMKTVVIGAILNIILDPIFIFVLDMGVQGAALATVIAQSISAIWVVKFLSSKESNIRLNLKKFVFDKKIIIASMALGISPFIMQSTEALVQISLNSQLQLYGGDTYVGSMTIILSVIQIIILPIQGFTMGTQSLISYNYGAKNIQRVRDAFKYLLMITVSLATFMSLVVMFFPEIFVRIFNNSDFELITLTSYGLRITLAGIFMFGFQMACQQTLLGLGQAKISLILALLRKIILFIPLIYVLPYFFGVDSIYYAQPIADIIAGTCTTIVFFMNFDRILRNRESHI